MGTYRRIEHPMFQAYDSNGDPLSGGKVYTYEAGTDTPKATYDESNSANDNPVVLDSTGRAEIYGTGYYKFILKDADDVTIWTLDNVQGVGETSIVDIGDYAGDFDAAVTAIGATETTLYIDSTATMSANTTVPTTLKVVVLKGGVIARSTHTLTMNGPFECGLYEAFTGSGTTVFGVGSVAEVFPEWEGIDGTADNTEIQLAITAAAAIKVPVALSQSTYSVSGSITLPANAMIYNKNISTITLANNTDADLFLVTGDNVTVKNIIAEGNKANQASGSFLVVDTPGGSIDNLRIENCEVSNFKEYGIQIVETCANHVYINNKIDSCDASGILVSPGVSDTSDNIRIEGNHVISSGVNGIQVYNSTNINNTNIFIIGNYVLSTTAVPIEIQRAKWGIISNNIVRGGTNGISVGSCQYATVSDNVIEDQTNNGIELADIDEGGNITVTGNEIYDVGTGIIANDSANLGSKVIISNNLIDTTTAQEGIETTGVSELVISGNVIKDPETTGIRVNGQGGSTDISDALISNNVIKFAAALSSGLSGISVLGLDGGVVSNNLIVTDVSGANEFNGLILFNGYNTNIHVTDNKILGTTAIVARGIYSGETTDDNLYILRNFIKNMKVGIQTSPNTNPEVTIWDNLIEGSSSADITAHASHKVDKLATSPTQGSLWRVSEVVWETAPTDSNPPGWICSSSVKTEMRIAAVATDTTMEVDDTTGMTTGDICGVELDNGTWHWTTATVTDGDTLELAAGLAGDGAAIDNDVVVFKFLPLAEVGTVKA